MTDTPNTGNNKPHYHDYIFFCDICGDITYASQATKLSIYTGRGGAIVCPDCVLAIDYGLVPYTAPAEKPVPWARTDANYDAPADQVPQLYPPFNFNGPAPSSGPPGYYAASSVTWDKQLFLTWDQWLGTPWQFLIGKI